MAMLPVDGSPSDSGLLVRAPGNASENVSASSGVLAGPVAGQGERGHVRQLERFASTGCIFRTPMIRGHAPARKRILYRASAGSTSVPSAPFVPLGQGSVTISARVR
jgi:hypothetical protein